MRKHAHGLSRGKKWLAGALILVAVAAGVLPFALSQFTGEDARLIQEGGEADGRLRVQLRSLGAPQLLTLTLDGVYSLESDPGFRFARGSILTVAYDEGSLLLDCGGMTIDMGPNFTLTRHEAPEGELNGIIIEQASKTALYNGDLELSARGNGIGALLYIDLEEYLYGVVPYEMSDSWPLEALKAQAVAARTYAMGRKSARVAMDYDLVDTTADQVFKGFNPGYTNAVEAVDSTKGIVGMYNGSFATCYYGASNGGQTVMPDEVMKKTGDYGYLEVKDDPYDLENSKSVVRTMEISAQGGELDPELTALLKAALSEQLAGMGCSEDAEDIRIVELLSLTTHEPKGREGSRMAQKLRVRLTIEARRWTDDELGAFELLETPLEVDLELYSQIKKTFSSMSINSSDCELYTVYALYADGTEEQIPIAQTLSQTEEDAADKQPVRFRIEARRFGHGVGMSQRGAQTMAGAHGLPYTDILLFYYPGIDLVRYAMPETELTDLDELPEGLGAERVIRIPPKPTPAPLPALEAGEKYGYVVLEADSSALN
ncbi:MAG: SpoIID/LytB domain-containing protein, partial [Eubacteriales bacterium]|nr:SpoIID/LytB domain-containing protein [Eubacteriales bacterium]